MTDKEFKRLGRAHLIEIIYQLQLQVETLKEEKQELENQLEDKRLRLEQAGNIAQAALEINGCFQSAQNAAEQYLNEIKAMREETEAERRRILEEARRKADSILAEGKAIRNDSVSDNEANSEESKTSRSDNG